MNQYANEKYYHETFGGRMTPEEGINKYLKLAQEKIDDITFNRIVSIGFDNLTEFQKDCVSKAVCHQAEYYVTNGINPLSNVSSYSVLDISVNIDKTTQTEAQLKDMDEMAYMIIKKSGLTSRLL